ncbi:hypothetical protein EVAR_6385_1 [Eumeta japonica]|uniref:Uncharacterized protein n=1 Tax=Eumeta variegata TaxID=151549 RepID=A0A4C1TDB6_EUMVA|nr:hypothetical protein EVAR_6385_1 [Eumeta japonica]
MRGRLTVRMIFSYDGLTSGVFRAFSGAARERRAACHTAALRFWREIEAKVTFSNFLKIFEKSNIHVSVALIFKNYHRDLLYNARNFAALNWLRMMYCAVVKPLCADDRLLLGVVEHSVWYSTTHETAALNCLRMMYCAGLTLPGPTFLSPACRFDAIATLS